MRQYQIDAMIAAAGAIVILAITAWVFLAVVRRRMAERHEIRRALLEKLSSEELVHLLENEGGRAWLRDVLSGPNDARAGIERAMQAIFAGLGCGAAAMLFHVRPLGVFGLILSAAGIGQLVAVAWLSRKRRDDA